MRGKPEFDKQNEYNKGKYDRIGLMLPKGKGEAWKAEASARGLSINAFVQKAVEFYLEAEARGDTPHPVIDCIVPPSST